MIAQHGVRYKRGRCRTIYSRDGVQWYLDQACTKPIKDKDISCA